MVCAVRQSQDGKINVWKTIFLDLRKKKATASSSASPVMSWELMRTVGRKVQWMRFRIKARLHTKSNIFSV